MIGIADVELHPMGIIDAEVAPLGLIDWDTISVVSSGVIKTFEGLARASTKTVLGVTQSTSVKTWVGVANQ